MRGLGISGLHCKRGRMEVLDVKELSIPKGAITAVIGENGAGKSNFSEFVCGLLKCKGDVEIDETRYPPKERVKKSYMVMQDVNHQLLCESVNQEITLNMDEKNEEKRESVEELLKQMRLEAFAERHPASLSGGQKQRVAICAALYAKKQILFLDEPTSGLDYEGMTQLGKLIEARGRELTATLIITHDLELVFECCTHVLHMEDGKIKDFYSLDSEGIKKVQQFFLREETIGIRS